MGRRRVQGFIDAHDNIVRDILDKIDMPFARVETFWFRKGEKRKGKNLYIDCDQDILISSYIDTGDGRQIRISNHEKKNGLPNGYIEYIYDWQTYKIIKKPSKEIWN
jgi:hypothetical protein